MSGNAKDAAARIRAAVEELAPGSYLLAVSGGRDSMVLLDGFARWRPADVTVATFDHGTSPASRRAVELVEREGERRGLAVVSARAEGLRDAGEAAWRDARWAFLNGWAAELGARVVTAHTRDDQAETVVIRILRDAGARGLAGMYAESGVARPLIDCTRDDVGSYAAARGVPFVDDPSNADNRHLRNRVRNDILPALERARPGFSDSLLALARQAARWRNGVEALVGDLVSEQANQRTGEQEFAEQTVVVPADALAALEPESLAVLWPAIAARAGVTLDWRGTERLVAFTSAARPRARVPLSGGAEALRTPTTFVIRAS